MKKHSATLTTIDPIFVQAASADHQYRCLNLGHSDVPAMAALQLRCGADNVVPRDADYYRDHFSNGHDAVGLFDSQGVLIAHALVRNAKGVTTMLNVLVDPQHRGQRLQGRMMESWMDTATRNGLQTASARVRIDNIASLKNFLSAGFTPVLEEPSPEAPDCMTYVVQKSLQPVAKITYAGIFRPSVVL